MTICLFAILTLLMYALSVVFFGKFLGLSSRARIKPTEEPVKKSSLDAVHDKHFKSIVEDGGGKFVGIQEVEGLHDDLVLFNSPKTGSTLAVKTSLCTSETVAMRLALHEDSWENIKHAQHVYGRA